MKSNRFPAHNTGYDRLYPVFTFREYRESRFFEARDIENKRELFNFFSNISSFSSLTWQQIKISGNYHFHEIDSDKDINSKLNVPEEISLIQFKLSGDRESRIIGYFDDRNVFNIVAYDYKHKIYPRK